VGFVIPSSKNKYYLSGSDWVINTLDYILKTETCAGNMSQIVFMLEGNLETASIETYLHRFSKEFPVIYGSIARDYNLAPYWRIPKEPSAGINLNVHEIGNNSYWEILENCINRPFKNDNEHLALHLIRKDKNPDCLAMTFDHRLFDARGAELFLNLFQQYVNAKDGHEIAKGFNFTAPANLSQWMQKFYAGRNVNRKMVALSRIPPGALPLTLEKNKGFKFKLISFSPQQTERIYEDAYNMAGYLMEMPYLLSAVIHTLHRLFKSKKISNRSYLIPVSIDMRTDENLKQELFFNHVSYLFFQILKDEAENFTEMINIVKNQMYEQIRAGLPKDIVEASLLMRIFPLRFLKKVFRIPFDGKIASFCFSHIGKSSYLFPDLMGVKVSNIFHMPRVPVPPGLGFFFNYFHNRLNLVISYLNGLIDDKEILMFETDIKERLGVCQD